jgi:hypothetical protein
MLSNALAVSVTIGMTRVLPTTSPCCASSASSQ